MTINNKKTAQYRNKNKLYEVCIECMELINHKEIKTTLLDYGYESLTEGDMFFCAVNKKARIFNSKNIAIEKVNESIMIENLLERNIDYNIVDIEAVLRAEYLLSIASYNDVGLDIASIINDVELNSDAIRLIVNKAFLDFDTMKNSETYKWNVYAVQEIISKMIRYYFEMVLAIEFIKIA